MTIKRKLPLYSQWLTITPAVILIFFMLGCERIDWKEVKGNQKENGNGFGNISPAMMLTWNDAAIHVVTATPQAPPNPPIPPFRDARFYAMVGIAMHDALNSIVPKYQTYALKNVRDKLADPDVAVAQAAHDVIVANFGTLNPPAKFTPQSVMDEINALLVTSLSASPDGDAKTRGIILGQAAAAAILQMRSTDGVANVQFPVVEGTVPGQYRFTPPFNGPPFNGFYDSPGWGQITPFGMSSGSQFRPGAPYAVNSNEYTKDYLEIKRLGCANCPERSAEQSEIALFWKEASSIGWNRIAVVLGQQKKLDAFRFARLIAMVNMSVADGYIGSLEAKMHYFYWRPISAVRLGDNDGNPNTPGDAGWDVFSPPTPPIADYPSAHSTAGGAAMGAMQAFFGTDQLSFTTTSGSLPNVSRSYNSLSSAAMENAMSRIYIGYHFRKACEEGVAMGNNIGKYIGKGYLKEN